MRNLDVTMAVTVGVLFAVGFYLMLQRPLMRIVFGFLVLGHGTNLLLLVAGGGPGEPPVVEGGSPAGDLRRFADPLPQAMVLTSIVITFGLSAFLLALAYRSWRLSGHDEVQDDLEDRLIGTSRERAGADPASDDVPAVEEDASGAGGSEGCPS
ncbi:Na(+)/H(+) antiporter subunit C [Streptomyces sp. RKND-216]|uniref:Na(+)/H(+) antiporter subunit C n=1 Tax=Streptomyces sp. RKND-216 TaxID=2562581 RepID=UPI00109DB78C|nr:Na(+)/H(+) antiporter subunit C [Streptomyces sp. RKND-216]THA24014.1 Na(+)/H(+) antiporter subunit C [Streptomyces sp. RKND-216]